MSTFGLAGRLACTVATASPTVPFLVRGRLFWLSSMLAPWVAAVVVTPEVWRAVDARPEPPRRRSTL